MDILLNDNEVRIANFIAKQRMAYGKSSGLKDRLVDKGKKEQHEIDGALAEIAFSRLSNTYPDFSTQASNDKTDNLVDGLSVDVKATRHPRGQLIAAIYKKPEDVDVYVLGIVEGHCVTFPGYAFSSDLIAQHRITNLGYGDVYAMKQGVLRGFEIGNKTLFKLS